MTESAAGYKWINGKKNNRRNKGITKETMEVTRSEWKK
jgi:hypothetical protein